MQSLAPGPAAVVLVEYRPAAHGPLHVLDVLLLVPYLPALQFSQVESPFELYLPAGQSLQCVAPSSLIKLATPVPSLSLLELVVKCPALQVLHDDPPVFVWYFPDSQAMQFAAPGPAAVELVEYRPAAQLPLHVSDVPPPAP